MGNSIRWRKWGAVCLAGAVALGAGWSPSARAQATPIAVGHSNMEFYGLQRTLSFAAVELPDGTVDAEATTLMAIMDYVGHMELDCATYLEDEVMLGGVVTHETNEWCPGCRYIFGVREGKTCDEDDVEDGSCVPGMITRYFIWPPPWYAPPPPEPEPGATWCEQAADYWGSAPEWLPQILQDFAPIEGGSIHVFW